GCGRCAGRGPGGAAARLVVDLLEVGDLVVETHEIELPVEVDVPRVLDGVPHAVLGQGCAVPLIACAVGGVRGDPIGDGQLVQGKRIGEVHHVVVGGGFPEIPQAGEHAVLPGAVLVAVADVHAP